MQVTNVMLIVIALAGASVGSIDVARSDDTSGAAACVGTGRETWDPLTSTWKPAWVGCAGGCSSGQGQCLVRRASVGGATETKVCGCIDLTTNEPIFDFTIVNLKKTSNCCPTEIWDRTSYPPTLTEVKCDGPCGTGSCQRDYVLQNPGVDREFKCVCQ